MIAFPVIRKKIPKSAGWSMSRIVTPGPAELLSIPGWQLRPAEREPTMDPRIAEALEYLRANCEKPVTEKQLASQCGLSRSRFAHLFRQQTGAAFRAARAELRLSRAACLLADHSLRIKQVAVMSGFAGSHSLDKAFRHRFGLKPAAYRRSTHGYRIAHGDTSIVLTV